MKTWIIVWALAMTWLLVSILVNGYVGLIVAGSIATPIVAHRIINRKKNYKIDEFKDTMLEELR